MFDTFVLLIPLTYLQAIAERALANMRPLGTPSEAKAVAEAELLRARAPPG